MPNDAQVRLLNYMNENLVEQAWKLDSSKTIEWQSQMQKANTLVWREGEIAAFKERILASFLLQKGANRLHKHADEHLVKQALDLTSLDSSWAYQVQKAGIFLTREIDIATFEQQALNTRLILTGTGQQWLDQAKNAFWKDSWDDFTLEQWRQKMLAAYNLLEVARSR